jgi:predicted ATP-grasp superfamily ATP-dependent carboligase
VAGAQVGGVDNESAAAAGKAIKMSAEFNRDGTAKITMMGQTHQGTYKINGENELEWTMSGITTKSKLNVTATELEVTDDANRTIKYKRK